MNTPSPLVPQGTFPEPRRRKILTVFFVILFIHVGFLAGLLLQGCKNEEAPKPAAETANLPTFGADTNAPAPVASLPTDATNTPPAGGTLPPPPGVPSGATPAPFAGAPAPAPGAGLGTVPAPAPLPLAPPPISAPAPAPVDGIASTIPSTEHTVLKGEIGAAIAKKYGMSWKAIEAANPGVDATKLKIGQKLIIPGKTVSAAPAGGAGLAPAEGASGGSTYTVKSGDTLVKIAKSHGTSVKALKDLNGLKLTTIKVGQKLKIPSKGEAAPAPAAAAPAVIPAPLAPAPVDTAPPPPAPLPLPTRNP